MLQDNSVRNLHYDSKIRVAQQSRFEPPVFEEPTRPAPQPPTTAPPRILLPVSTIDQQVSAHGSRTFIPVTGYDVLADLPSVYIEQTFELNDSLTSVSSENRYTIRTPLGEAIFAATESSTANDRLIWGSARPFQMHLLDKTHQEALVFQKKLALGLFCCRPRKLEVWAPPGNVLGRIVETPSMLVPEFVIEDDKNQHLFHITGQKNAGLCCFCLPKETYFKIFSGNDIKASIHRKWSQRSCQYTTNIYFVDSGLDIKSKALCVGAAFLIEYMYFQGTY